MLNVRYDPASRTGFVKLRPGRAVRTRELSAQSTGEYDVRDRLIAITVTELDETSAEFLRTADEDTLLAVIRAQAGRRKAGRPSPPAGAMPERGDGSSRPRPKAKPRPRPTAKAAPAEPAAAPKRRRRRRAAKPGGGTAPASGESAS